jgi:hypothetical protein
MGELVSQEHRESIGEKEEPGKWNCLRCGGRVTKAWRVGPDPSEPVVEVDKVSSGAINPSEIDIVDT